MRGALSTMAREAADNRRNHLRIGDSRRDMRSTDRRVVRLLVAMMGASHRWVVTTTILARRRRLGRRPPHHRKSKEFENLPISRLTQARKKKSFLAPAASAERKRYIADRFDALFD